MRNIYAALRRKQNASLLPQKYQCKYKLVEYSKNVPKWFSIHHISLFIPITNCSVSKLEYTFIMYVPQCFDRMTIKCNSTSQVVVGLFNCNTSTIKKWLLLCHQKGREIAQNNPMVMGTMCPKQWKEALVLLCLQQRVQRYLNKNLYNLENSPATTPWHPKKMQMPWLHLHFYYSWVVTVVNIQTIPNLFHTWKSLVQSRLVF